MGTGDVTSAGGEGRQWKEADVSGRRWTSVEGGSGVSLVEDDQVNVIHRNVAYLVAPDVSLHTVHRSFFPPGPFRVIL